MNKEFLAALQATRTRLNASDYYDILVRLSPETWSVLIIKIVSMCLMRRICENQYDEDKVESLQVQGSFLQFQEMLQNFILEAQVEIEIEDRY